MLNGAFLYVVTFALYTYTFATIERSISVSMLIDIESASSKGINYRKIMDIVTEKEVKKRIEYFIKAGYVTNEDDVLKITRSGQIYALIGKFLKQLVV